MKGEVETQFLLSGLLLHTQPLHSSEKHTRAHLEFFSHFGNLIEYVHRLVDSGFFKNFLGYLKTLSPKAEKGKDWKTSILLVAF